MTARSLIILWAVPRSRSTAFERMMAERGDVEVVHEPFSYLVESGQFTVDGTVATTLTGLFELLLARAGDHRVFVKETSDYSYADLLADPRLYEEVTNTFLIRRPEEVIASYHAMKPQMTLDEVGFDRLCEIFRRVKASGGSPIVAEADDLVHEPEKLVQVYCERVGLAFLPESLHWSAGDRPEWSKTGQWHRDASASTGFADFVRDHAARPDNDPWLAEVAAYHRPFYEEMRGFRLVATANAG
jgi:hypothetical protein